MTGYVVAPSAVTARMMEQLLKRAGCTRVESWLDGTEASTHLENSPRCDILVTEWDLPGVSGLELARTLRTHGPADNPAAIILVSARNTGEDVREALEAGVDAYLLKPFDPDVFVERMAGMLKKKTPLEPVKTVEEMAGSGMTEEVPTPTAATQTDPSAPAEGVAAEDEVEKQAA